MRLMANVVRRRCAVNKHMKKQPIVEYWREQWRQDLLEELRIEAEALNEKRRKHDKEYADKLWKEWLGKQD
jgi:hypothetical protein